MPLTPEDILARAPRPPATFSASQMLKSLGLRKKDQKQVKKVLREMALKGRIVRKKGGRFALPLQVPLVSGTLRAHPDGYGFVLPDAKGEADIYIHSRNMSEAMDGDRVTVQVQSVRADGSREGAIARVLERAHRRVVGRFERADPLSRRPGYVVPQNPRLHHDIFIAPQHTLGARDGDLVVAELLVYPTPKRNPEGRIVRVLGRVGDPAIDTEMVVEDLSLPASFPSECLSVARSLPQQVQDPMRLGRRDLRDLKTVTIDGEKARDFDDAVSIERVGDRGGFRLWVHIADVAHYVDFKTPLDQEARKRGNSVYFPDRVLPMFPEQLSDGICSLNPREDRLTLTAEMLFDASGLRLDYWVYESVIHSDERMTYTQVKQILEENSPSLQRRYARLLDDFHAMRDLCLLLRARRMERGSIDFDLPEPEIILDMQGQTAQIVRQERNIAHWIIEEFMLSANETVAEHLTEAGGPMIYRVHEEPAPEKIMQLNEVLESFGLYLPKAGKVEPRGLQAILEAVRGRPEEKLINTLVLRSMKQARYAEEHLSHFGLAAACYTHFTSPIRRYPDLVIHRLLKSRIRGRRTGLPSEETLAEIARHCSDRERVAMEAERRVMDIKKTRFMADKQGQVFDGHVSGVLPIGFFVELDEIFVEGLVPVSSLKDDYYLFQESLHGLVGTRRRKVYRLGDPVRVRVAEVDLVRYRVNFSPENAGRVAEGKRLAPPKGGRRRRRPPSRR